MRYKRSLDFQPSITLSTAQLWDATVSYPGSTEPVVQYRAEEVCSLRKHIFETYPEYIEE